MLAALRKAGWKTSNVKRGSKKKLPERCVVKLAGGGGTVGHWLVRDGDRLYDPNKPAVRAWNEPNNRSALIELYGRG